MEVEKEKNIKIYGITINIMNQKSVLTVFLFSTVKNQIIELKKQFFKTNQILVAPINLMSGFYLTFLWFDFTRVSYF
jgi:hypothetical protein